MDWFANINLSGNEIQNFLVHKLATAPTAVAGKQYYDTAENKFKGYNGTSWIELGGATMSGADIVAAINASASAIDDDNLSAAAQAAISASHTQNTDTGTTSSVFQIDSGNTGPKIKNSSGEVQFRNAADNAYADFRCKNIYIEGDTTIIVSNTMEIGDSEILLNQDILVSSGNSDGGMSVKRLMADDLTRKDAKIIFNNTTGRWQLVYGAVTETLTTASVAAKYSQAIGDGSNTSIAVTHNLKTRDCVVGIRETATPYEAVMCDWAYTDENTITFTFAVAPTASQFTVTIIG